ncbi:nuclear transport factor 2 family protein [Myroides pelagicus]|uniref:Steroid delta-isomerase n=1 Tax=Myroides pelagicus TaxID=270914 RepID=A0A7K1GNC1_9FLAO|nr:nuclear transport factor 2 family protein [Myroides pelagicus]MEC4114359.1 nuclear transport factor 2 family protein [Myroides pelagicus]MTH29883.1 steroid delta-isomerase [Myroides pelagicus]
MLEQSNTAEKIVQKQLDAYNQRNLADFLSLYTADIKIYNFGEEVPFIDGLQDLENIYNTVFEQSPNLHAVIKNRIVFDNKVIDQEEVSGRMGMDKVIVVVIYEVEYNLISKVTFIRKRPI